MDLNRTLDLVAHPVPATRNSRAHYDDVPTLGDRLRAARYARNLTQQDLAGDTFSKSYISAIERGKMTPSIQALRLLATRLDVTLASLLGEDSRPQSDTDTPAEEILTERLDEAETLLYQGDPTAALAHLGNEEAGSEVRLQNPARWEWLRGWALLQLDQEEEAMVLIQHGLQEAETSQAPCALGHFAFTLATAQAAKQDLEAAEHGFQTALRCAEEAADPTLLSLTQEHYAALLAAQGRYQHAYRVLQAAMSAAPGRGSLYQGRSTGSA
jgi:transcriptional regulator with XRE-family HTH domain